MDNKRLPHDLQSWKRATVKENIKDRTIHDLQLSSASKIDYRQYLLLRVLQKSETREFDARLFDLDDALKEAKGILESYSDWRDYHQNVKRDRDPNSIIPKLGTFSLVEHWQSQVTNVPQYNNDEEPNVVVFSPIQTRSRTQGRSTGIESRMRTLHLETPTKKGGISEIPPDSESDSPESQASTFAFEEFSPIPIEAERILYPPTEDEQIVNNALVLLLNSLTIHFSLHNTWTFHRRPFTASFRTAAFQARVDGYLRDKTHDRVRGLVEVKAHIRRSAVQMQEAAQMVAWICDEKQKPIQSPGRYFSIAQNRHHIYLIFAQFEDNYLKYLKDGTTSNDRTSFLTMYEFGPWDICDQEAIKQFGEIVLAISIRASRDRGLDDEAKSGRGRR